MVDRPKLRISFWLTLPAVLCLVVQVGCRQDEVASHSLLDAGARAMPVDSVDIHQSDTIRTGPFVQVLGIGQDGGIPQAGKVFDDRWKDRVTHQLVASLGVVDPKTSTFWLFDATPDFPDQLTAVARSLDPDTLVLGGVLLTHAHIGHYTGLMYLGHEAMGAKGIPVYALPRMTRFLRTNGPWDQLVRFGNIDLLPIDESTGIDLSTNLSVEAIRVPHRQEYSEVVGYRVQGPEKSLIYVPDIDSWNELDETGISIESLIADVDFAFLDGTFFENGELPGRDMSGFPHPFIRTSMERFSVLDKSERSKIYFIHLNHSNPALHKSSSQRLELESTGMHIAEQGMIVGL